MAMSWFRYHADVINNKRIQNLPPELFKFWVNCQCILALEDVGNSGKLPPIEQCAFYLRMSVEETVNKFEELHEKGVFLKREVKRNETPVKQKTLENETLFDRKEYNYFLRNWGKKQYKSDSSTERVKRFRERSKGDTGNGLDQSQNQNRTDQTREDLLNSENDRGKKARPRNYNIEMFLKDDERERLKQKTRDWDFHELVTKFNTFINKKAKEYPKYPYKAFDAWIISFTEGNKP
jgi:hypothetical protein